MTAIKRTLLAATVSTVVLTGGYLGLSSALATKPADACGCCTCAECTCDPCQCCGCGTGCTCDGK